MGGSGSGKARGTPTLTAGGEIEGEEENLQRFSLCLHIRLLRRWAGGLKHSAVYIVRIIKEAKNRLGAQIFENSFVMPQMGRRGPAKNLRAGCRFLEIFFATPGMAQGRLRFR